MTIKELPSKKVQINLLGYLTMKKTLKFKTNIKCMGCVTTVTPALNETVGIGNWEVDLRSPDRELTVNIEEKETDNMIAALAQIGYQAEAIGQAN